jgi:hypothetical protein
MSNDWIADIVVVNESRDEAEAGDVTIFRSVGEACDWLEHWWVENEEGFAFTATGERLALGVDDKGRVVVAARQIVPGGTEIVLGWLRAAAAAVLEARKARAQDGKLILNSYERQGQLPTSIEGLIIYVGFRN